MKKKYKIAGTWWIQEPLRYAESERVNVILKERKLDFGVVASGEIGRMVDRIYDSGVLPQLIPIILKPSSETRWKRLWNLRVIQKRGLSSENILTRMTDDDIARVMIDFFVIRSAWLTNLLISWSDSESKQKKIKEKNPSESRNDSTPFQTAIFANQN